MQKSYKIKAKHVQSHTGLSHKVGSLTSVSEIGYENVHIYLMHCLQRFLLSADAAMCTQIQTVRTLALIWSQTV